MIFKVQYQNGTIEEQEFASKREAEEFLIAYEKASAEDVGEFGWEYSTREDELAGWGRLESYVFTYDAKSGEKVNEGHAYCRKIEEE